VTRVCAWCEGPVPVRYAWEPVIYHGGASRGAPRVGSGPGGRVGPGRGRRLAPVVFPGVRRVGSGLGGRVGPGRGRRHGPVGRGPGRRLPVPAGGGPVTARTVQGMAPYPGQARCLALGFWPESFRRLMSRVAGGHFRPETRSALDIDGKHVTIQGPSSELIPSEPLPPDLRQRRAVGPSTPDLRLVAVVLSET